MPVISHRLSIKKDSSLSSGVLSHLRRRRTQKLLSIFMLKFNTIARHIKKLVFNLFNIAHFLPKVKGKIIANIAIGWLCRRALWIKSQI